MENRSIYLNLSPLDHRYYLSNRKLYEQLSTYLSEQASVRYNAMAEISLLKAHLDHLMPERKDLRESLVGLEDKIDPDEVYSEEEKTQHNIRALVNVMKKQVPDEINPLVHMGATSVDILDTAASMKMRDAYQKVILPLLYELEEELIRLAETHAETPQVGRTHGQHAVPVTLGFAFAEYVSRLGQSIGEINKLAADLRGKLSGAVGGYNATSMIVSDPEELEKSYNNYCGLKPSEYSTQMVESEYMLRLLLETNTAFGIIANLADDLRHLQRSEISEVREYFSPTQVGSSTMPQKRNPWNCEHVKSLWKAFAPRIMSFYMDQISEHQRDLSNSASARFQADYVAGFVAATARMNKILKGLTADHEKLTANLKVQGDLVLAEPTYILLAMAGEFDGHEIVRKLTLLCDQSGKTLHEVFKEELPEKWETVKNQLKMVTDLDADDFYKNPALYRGKTVEKTRSLAAMYTVALKEWRAE